MAGNSSETDAGEGGDEDPGEGRSGLGLGHRSQQEGQAEQNVQTRIEN
jgi:hypothetical protein